MLGGAPVVYVGVLHVFMYFIECAVGLCNHSDHVNKSSQKNDQSICRDMMSVRHASSLQQIPAGQCMWQSCQLRSQRRKHCPLTACWPVVIVLVWFPLFEHSSPPIEQSDSRLSPSHLQSPYLFLVLMILLVLFSLHL